MRYENTCPDRDKSDRILREVLSDYFNFADFLAKIEGSKVSQQLFSCLTDKDFLKISTNSLIEEEYNYIYINQGLASKDVG